MADLVPGTFLLCSHKSLNVFGHLIFLILRVEVIGCTAINFTVSHTYPRQYYYTCDLTMH